MILNEVLPIKIVVTSNTEVKLGPRVLALDDNRCILVVMYAGFCFFFLEIYSSVQFLDVRQYQSIYRSFSHYIYIYIMRIKRTQVAFFYFFFVYLSNISHFLKFLVYGDGE